MILGVLKQLKDGKSAMIQIVFEMRDKYQKMYEDSLVFLVWVESSSLVVRSRLYLVMSKVLAYELDSNDSIFLIL